MSLLQVVFLVPFRSGLLRPTEPFTRMQRLRIVQISGRRLNSSLASQPPEHPLARVQFNKKHEETAGRSRGSLIAERAQVSGGPTANKVA
jgi:hypothetical protein